MACSIRYHVYAIHGQEEGYRNETVGRVFPRVREERTVRNFPSGIFLSRKAAGKEISSCIFLRAVDISRRLRAHVASLRDFTSLDSLLFVRHGAAGTTKRETDRQIDRQERRVRAMTVSVM